MFVVASCKMQDAVTSEADQNDEDLDVL